MWNTKVGDYQKGEYMTLEPLVVHGKVMVGSSGGEFGVRGFIAAYDADDGKQAWRLYTVPARTSRAAIPGRPMHGRPAAARSGSPATMTRRRNIAYWGVGNAAPWPGDLHPGDNLYTSSTIALNPDTGKIEGYFQYQLEQLMGLGRDRPPVLISMHARRPDDRCARAPWAQRLSVDAAADATAVSSSSPAKPFVYQNAFKSLDPKTGRPTYNEDHKPTTARM